MRKQLKKSKVKVHEEETAGQTPPKVDISTLSDDLSGVLEEIDTLLEENAEEFLASFVQLGGE